MAKTSLTNKIIGVAIGLSVSLSVLTSVLAPAIVDAQADSNLTAYVAVIGLILLIFIFGLIMYIWKEMGH